MGQSNDKGKFHPSTEASNPAAKLSAAVPAGDCAKTRPLGCGTNMSGKVMVFQENGYSFAIQS
jgi:trans-aconitate methyltransferase